MANSDQGGGFGVGLLLGGLAGLIAGVWVASGPGRSQVETLRDRTIELTSRSAGLAREVINNPEHPVGRALQDGLSAARQRRGELQDAELAGASNLTVEPDSGPESPLTGA